MACRRRIGRGSSRWVPVAKVGFVGLVLLLAGCGQRPVPPDTSRADSQAEELRARVVNQGDR